MLSPTIRPWYFIAGSAWALVACGSEDSTRSNPSVDASTADGSVAVGGSGGAARGGGGGTGALAGMGAGGAMGGNSGTGAMGGSSGGSAGSGTGGGGGGVSSCPDVSSFTWSMPALVETATDADEVAVGVDGSGRAFALLQGDIGAANSLRRVVYDPVTGWGTAQPVNDSPLGNNYAAQVFVNPAGDVLMAYLRNGSMLRGLFDTSGNSQNSGTGDAVVFFGGFGLSDDGATLVGYTALDEGRNKGFVSIDFAPGVALFDGMPSAQVTATSLDPDGNGAVFGPAPDGTASVMMYSPTTGFSPPEPVHHANFSPAGAAGASLQGGAALAAFQDTVDVGGGTMENQLIATYRSAAGTWSTGSRFDSHDGTGTLQVREVASSAANVAFVLWLQSGGPRVGRFDGSAAVGDTLALGAAANNWSLATDRCGNAAVSYVEGGAVHVRYYRAGVGWLPDTALTGFVQTDTALALGPTGEAMLLYTQQSQFFYAKFGP